MRLKLILLTYLTLVMLALTFVLLPLSLVEAQTLTSTPGIEPPIDLTSLVGDWTLYPLIIYSSGVAVVDTRDLTSEQGRPVTLSLSDDGKHLIAQDNGLYSSGGWFEYVSKETFDQLDRVPLSSLAPNHYGATLEYGGTLNDVMDYELAIDLDLHAVSGSRIDVIQEDVAFELSVIEKSILVRGSDDPRPALLPYPTCPGAPVSHLMPNEDGRVNYQQGLNLRDKPGKAGKKVAGLDFMTDFKVLDGPQCADNMAYWQVEVNGKTGWASEGVADAYWIGQSPNVAPEPFTIPNFYGSSGPLVIYRPQDDGTLVLKSDTTASDTTTGSTSAVAACPGGAQPRLQIGGQATVLPGDPNVLNTKPAPHSADPTSQKIVLIPSGDIVDVIGGPVCANDITWWQVNYLGKTGWTGEMQGTTYWMRPLP